MIRRIPTNAITIMIIITLITTKPVNDERSSYYKNILKETRVDHIISNNLKYQINDKKLMNVNASD